MRKRELILQTFMAAGVFSLCRVVHAQRLLVVNYHRILDAKQGNPFDEGVVTCSPEVFEEQIRYISRHRTVISMHDFVSSLRTGNQLPPRPTLLTFDDGYADNFRIAFPILKRYRAMACFFLPTNRFANRRLEWWDHIAYAVKNSTREVSTVRFGGTEHFLELGSSRAREAAIGRLIAVAKNTDANAFDLYAQLDTDPPSKELESNEIMTDEEVRTILHEPGFAIGAHSVSHAVLSTLSEERQEIELAESRRFLEERFDTTIETFAYPVGDIGHYDKTSKRAAKKAGYLAAFNFRREATDVDLSRLDRFDIDRVGATRSAGAVFRARASGFFVI